MKPIALTAAVALLSLTGCSVAQKPLSITAPYAPKEPVREVARALAAQGVAAGLVDADAGVVKSRWEDTGLLYGQLGGLPATIVRRYSVNVAVVGGLSELTLRQETLRCPRDRETSYRPLARMAGCEPMAGVLPEHQEALVRLGHDLGARIAARAGAAEVRLAGHP